jgi:hypothetical protein
VIGPDVSAESAHLAEFPDNFPVSRELADGDRFEYNCVRHHVVQRKTEIPRLVANCPELAAVRAGTLSLQNVDLISEAIPG